MKIKLACFSLFLLLLLTSSSYALFDTGTAMAKGKLELDVCVNPFRNIDYGQNWVFWHYGLGNEWEYHGYLSKWGNIFDWQGSDYEGYMGFLKQWANYEKLDLATCLGIRKIFDSLSNPSLIGPGILYTIKLTPQVRMAGHLQYIGEISENDGHIGIKKLNLGYTSEIGLYNKFNETVELAVGVFTNSMGEPRPIYTVNFYF